VRSAVGLNTVEVQTRKLAQADEQFIIRKRLLEPPRAETRCIRAHEGAGIGDAADIGDHVTASLPETGDMKFNGVTES
jgi:hypothetical protein